MISQRLCCTAYVVSLILSITCTILLRLDVRLNSMIRFSQRLVIHMTYLWFRNLLLVILLLRLLVICYLSQLFIIQVASKTSFSAFVKARCYFETPIWLIISFFGVEKLLRSCTMRKKALILCKTFSPVCIYILVVKNLVWC